MEPGTSSCVSPVGSGMTVVNACICQMNGANKELKEGVPASARAAHGGPLSETQLFKDDRVSISGGESGLLPREHDVCGKRQL